MKSPLLLLFLFPTLLGAQSATADATYFRLVDSAFVQLQKGECRPCISLYQQAFERSQHSPLSHLRAALCAHWCGDSTKTAYFINKAVALGWATCEQFLDKPGEYPEFRSVLGTPLETAIRTAAHRQAVANGINFELLATLREIHYYDQWYRRAADSVRAAHPDGPEYLEFNRRGHEQDSINMAKIEAIIQQYGYPGKSLVGDVEGSTAWLVIQHAPLDKQEQFLPVITEAAEKGELRKSDWAMLVDRVRMYRGQPQIYGSQCRYNPDGQLILHEIEDEAHVNERRAAVGLGPLEEYARRMGVEWKPPKN